MLWLLSWDLKFNDRFVHFSSVFCQTTGAAMGGATSAQTSSLTLLYLERSLDTPSLPPCFRNRDKFLVLHDPSPNHRPSALTVTDVRDKLSDLLHMELTVEARRCSLGFLESQVTFKNDGPAIFVKTPQFQGQPGDSLPTAAKKWLDKHGPIAKAMLGSLVPNLAKKCAHYRPCHAPCMPWIPTM